MLHARSGDRVEVQRNEQCRRCNKHQADMLLARAARARGASRRSMRALLPPSRPPLSHPPDGRRSLSCRTHSNETRYLRSDARTGPKSRASPQRDARFFPAHLAALALSAHSLVHRSDVCSRKLAHAHPHAGGWRRLALVRNQGIAKDPAFALLDRAWCASSPPECSGAP